MSTVKEVINYNEDHFRSNVKTNVGYFVVDSTITPNNEWETMVFQSDSKFNVECWIAVYTEDHDSKDEMIERHDEICNNLEDYV